MGETLAKIWLMLCGLAIVAGLILLAVSSTTALIIEGGLTLIFITIAAMATLGWFEGW